MRKLQDFTRPVAGLAAAVSLAFSATVQAEPSQISSAKLDTTVAQIRAIYDVPGMAIAIVEGDEVVFAKGYGVHESGEAAEVSTRTLFKIASVTKNFTTAALALLVDQGSSTGTTRSSTIFLNFASRIHG